MCSGSYERGKSGVNVMLNQHTREKLVEVARKSSRVRGVKLIHEQQVINVFRACVPEGECDNAEEARSGKKLMKY